MFFIRWLVSAISNLFSGLGSVLNFFCNLGGSLWSWITTGNTSGFESLFGDLSSFSDNIWDFIQQFNIFGDFGVDILYDWIPESQVVGALTYMFTFLCLIGSLKLLKKILPFW